MFSAGMSIGAGAGTAILGGALMAASYTGHTTEEEDRRWTQDITDAAMSASSPGSLVGGGIGYAVGGREGMNKGALIGGLVEGVTAIGVAGVRAAGLRGAPAVAKIDAPLGEATLETWREMTKQQRRLYEIGQTTVRSGVWKQMGKLGIQGNPIAKGAFLSWRYGGRLGRLGIQFKAGSLLGFFKTLGTGGTPAARYVGSPLILGSTLLAKSFGIHTEQEFNKLTY
jgi:hypothetical protein